jgi:hypothetical protein
MPFRDNLHFAHGMEMGASEAHCSAPLDVRWSLACFPALEHDALD